MAEQLNFDIIESPESKPKSSERGAILSPDGIYRYNLWRLWDKSVVPLIFVGLNPSTADGEKDDPTILKCTHFASSWGYGGFYMVNLFALRATDPKELKKSADPIGPENDSYLLQMFGKSGLVLPIWGTKGIFMGRDRAVLEMLRLRRVDVFCLGQTKDGHPRHPLYLKNETKMVPFPIKMGES